MLKLNQRHRLVCEFKFKKKKKKTIPCIQAKILPSSEVGVANTRTPFPAIVKIPTVFSGLAYKFNQTPFFIIKKKFKQNHKKKFLT